MRGPLRRFAVVAFCVLAVSRLSGGEPLRMQLFPAVAREPAVLTIRVTVEAADENRVLQVVAESSTFYRSSEVQIDGKRSSGPERVRVSQRSHWPLQRHERIDRPARPARQRLASGQNESRQSARDHNPAGKDTPAPSQSVLTLC